MLVQIAIHQIAKKEKEPKRKKTYVLSYVLFFIGQDCDGTYSFHHSSLHHSPFADRDFRAYYGVKGQTFAPYYFL